MRKQELIQKISQQTGIDPLTSQSVMASFFAVVKEWLAEGEPIYIRRFGSFMLKRRAPKIGRNISQRTSVQIAAQVVPAFKPSDEFIALVRAQSVPTKPEKANVYLPERPTAALPGDNC